MNRRYRKTIIAGNWKMNKTATEAKKFADDFKALLPKTKWCDVVVCVPSVDISAAVRAKNTSSTSSRDSTKSFRFIFAPPYTNRQPSSTGAAAKAPATLRPTGALA